MSTSIIICKKITKITTIKIIANIRNRYDLLDDEAKALVKNVELLEQVESNEGCNGSVSLSLLSIMILGIVMILSRRRRGDYNEEN